MTTRSEAIAYWRHIWLSGNWSNDKDWYAGGYLSYLSGYNKVFGGQYDAKTTEDWYMGYEDAEGDWSIQE